MIENENSQAIEGEIIEEGTPEEFFTAAKNERTAKFLAHIL